MWTGYIFTSGFNGVTVPWTFSAPGVQSHQYHHPFHREEHSITSYMAKYAGNTGLLCDE